MYFLKTITIFCLLALTSNVSFSQIKYGAKLNLGTSWISSSNLKNNFEFQMNRDPDIRDWDVNYSPGIMIGIGAVAIYGLSDNLSLTGELSYNHQQSNINIDYLEDDRVSGNGETETINSEAQISSSRLSLPVTLNYSLGVDKPVLRAGLEVNLLGTPKIDSKESEIVKAFENNNLRGQQLDAEAITADLDEFKNTRLNFLLGAGKSVDVGGKKLSLQVTYHLPLTSSDMYNKNSSIQFDDNTFKNNEVFGAFGKTDAEQDAVEFPLNDFKMHFLDLSVTYIF